MDRFTLSEPAARDWLNRVIRQTETGVNEDPPEDQIGLDTHYSIASETASGGTTWQLIEAAQRRDIIHDNHHPAEPAILWVYDPDDGTTSGYKEAAEGSSGKED